MSTLSKPMFLYTDPPFRSSLFSEKAPRMNQAPTRGSDFVSPATASGVSFEPPRCAEKGCIFPASADSGLWCAHHEREQREPALFTSRQPSHLVIERAAYEPADSEEALFRARDRRMRARLWEAFTNEGLGDGEE